MICRTAAILSVTMFICTGCVKRTEVITVLADGSGKLASQFDGDPDDIRQGDPLLGPDSLEWRVADQIETKDDGKQELHRSASRTVRAGEAWPATYAAPGDPEAAIALSFPTTLTIEERTDGTYYHFRRAYQRRPWAFVDYISKQILESDKIKGIGEKDPAEVTEADRDVLVQALKSVEAAKTVKFLESANQQTEGLLLQEQFLALSKAAVSVYNSDAVNARVRSLVSGKQDEIDIGALEDQIRTNIVDAVRSSLQSAGLPSLQADQFVDAYQQLRRQYEMTEDLGDESWEVKLTMPGRIIAANTPEWLGLDKTNDANITVTETPAGESSEVIWQFEGRALYDRDVVLMATSRVAKEK